MSDPRTRAHARRELREECERSCGTCRLKINAPAQVVAVMGAIHYCPIHRVYVRPDEPPCVHHKPERRSRPATSKTSNAHTREKG